METTFITIHDLSMDARILYASNSVTDILGYDPGEVVNKSSWEFFHPDEIPFAKAIHGRGIHLDKAAVLNYCQLRSKRGHWIGCECVFTVVNDVLIGCTSVYREGERSLRRATDAPIIRQLFSSSPRDPRYHMLSYISAKFSQASDVHAHEPRAALFLNRFTKTLPIMFATNGLEDLLGISSEELRDKSFYYCIQENCLHEAIRCLEGAKANDSIAYLRFWFRDPREGEQPPDRTGPDDDRSEAPSSDADDDEEGGVQIITAMDTDSSDYAIRSTSSGFASSRERRGLPHSHYSLNNFSSNSSGASTDGRRRSAIFDSFPAAESSASSLPAEPAERDEPPRREIEIEAVVSCTSDGLVVIMRAARPFALDTLRQPTRITEPQYRNGLFASPWASEPILPAPMQQGQQERELNGAYRLSGAPMWSEGGLHGQQLPGPPTEDFMNSIREVAVFAWALTGINGSLAQYSRGKPMPGALPFSGMPVWRPNSSQDGDFEMDVS